MATPVPLPVYKPGSEIDAYCTSCKADKMHRIIAMLGTAPKKVECLSCKGHHLYRPTAAQKEAAAAHKRASRADRSSTVKVKPRLSGIGPVPRVKEDLSVTWEKAVTGKGFNDFKVYRMDLTFAKGEVIRHAKFGEGVVTQVVETDKCEILFKDGLKMLAQARQLA